MAEIIPSEPGQVMLPRNVSLIYSASRKFFRMNVFMNQQAYALESGNSLLALLTEQNLADKKGIAVALNNQVVPRAKWADCHLSENDKVVVITATQGG